MNSKKILFVCKYNAFRSRVAEEYFNKINADRRMNVTSRGIIMGGSSDNIQRKIANKLLRINISKRKPLPLTIWDMEDADLIVVVADDVPKIVFNNPLPSIQKKLIIWNVKDEQGMNKENIKNIVLTIKRKVDEFSRKLGRAK